jgi:hypothetical protein
MTTQKMDVCYCIDLMKLVGGPAANQRAFKNAVCMWFNHVVMVRNTDLINVEYPWKFVTRGIKI